MHELIGHKNTININSEYFHFMSFLNTFIHQKKDKSLHLWV